MRSHFAAVDAIAARVLKEDITQALATATMGGYKRLWVFTDALPHVIKMVMDRLDRRAIAQLGITDLQVLNPTVDKEMELLKRANHELTLVVRCD